VGEAGPTGEAADHRAGDRLAIQTQNTVNPAGQVGSEPIAKGQEFTYSVRAQGRLTSPEEFEQIVVRETPETGIVRVDVARVELGLAGLQRDRPLNGKPSAVIALYQLPGSNAVEAAAGVKKADGGSEEALSRRHRLRRPSIPRSR
jgi:hydrophobic/amphiphilic exporter-1 (mainly G- bacteria), HAE1 family